MPRWALLVFSGAGHEVADGFAWGFVLVEEEADLFGDGHFYAVACGEGEGGGGGADAYGYFAVEVREGEREGSAAA